MKRDFCLQVSVEKYANVKFNENSSSRSLVLPRGRTDGGTDRIDDACSGPLELRASNYKRNP